jgi:hypothetical protein
MKFSVLILILCFTLVCIGCAVGGKSGAQTPSQSPSTVTQPASCNLALIYNCTDAVVGQSYICTPTVTQVDPYPCDDPPASAQASIQAKVKPARAITDRR